MFEVLRKTTWGIFRRVIGSTLTSPALRWLWRSSSDHDYSIALGDFRPADIDTVTEMAGGRYLFDGKLVDTAGVSPFSTKIDHYGWRHELQGFSWLRHFADVHDPGLRKFARTLVLDWIGRFGKAYDPEIWSLDSTAQRALNWMRHLDLLFDGANGPQRRAMNRALGRQVRSLRLRAPFSADPLDLLRMRVVVLAASLVENGAAETVAHNLVALEQEIDRQFDLTGLHRSRSPSVQVEILSDLITLRQAMARREQVHLGTLPSRMSAMHAALAALTLGTGELGYFNGTGQEATDLLVSLQAMGGAQTPQTGLVGGYGTLRGIEAVLVADSGLVPPPDFAGRAHAGALSFEFSHGHELIIGNCGPAPAELHTQSRPFRLGAAHSAPTIDYRSSANVIAKGLNAGTLVSSAPPPELDIDVAEQVLKLTSHAYEASAGVTLSRWLTLLMGGDTLVGQDRITATASGVTGHEVILRFHLGPGVEALRDPNEDIIRLRLASGHVWSFLWEGARAEIEDSVRQSAFFGFYRTRQIILTAPLSDTLEIAWILTRAS